MAVFQIYLSDQEAYDLIRLTDRLNTDPKSVIRGSLKLYREFAPSLASAHQGTDTLDVIRGVLKDHLKGTIYEIDDTTGEDVE
jgi:hypothetical protein